MSKGTLHLGREGEAEAAEFLKSSGYKILIRNYKNKLGEIDIIAKDADTVCFIEVKSRAGEKFGLPEEAVNKFKQNQISKVALVFLKENKLFDQAARFDIVSIDRSRTPAVKVIKNAFELNERYST
jgi:putative endonuclease